MSYLNTLQQFIWLKGLLVTWMWKSVRDNSDQVSSQSSILIKIIFYISMYVLAKRGPALHRKINAFFVKQSFFSNDLYRFRSLGTPGKGGRVVRVRLVSRTFPELVWRSVQNLVEIGLAVCAWKRDPGTFFKHIDENEEFVCLYVTFFTWVCQQKL